METDMPRWEVDLELQGAGMMFGACVPVEAENERQAIDLAIDKFWNDGARFEGLHKGQIVIDQVTRDWESEANSENLPRS